MSWNLSIAFSWATRIAFFSIVLFPAIVQSGTLTKPTAARGSVVWVLFASSSECPRCDGVTEFLSVLKKKYHDSYQET